MSDLAYIALAFIFGFAMGARTMVLQARHEARVKQKVLDGLQADAALAAFNAGYRP